MTTVIIGCQTPDDDGRSPAQDVGAELSIRVDHRRRKVPCSELLGTVDSARPGGVAVAETVAAAVDDDELGPLVDVQLASTRTAAHRTFVIIGCLTPDDDTR
jgi:hypothetical protein